MLEIMTSRGEEREKEGIVSRRLHIAILKMKIILRSQAACRSNIETSSVCTYTFHRSASLLVVFQFPLFTKTAQKSKALLRGCCSHPGSMHRTLPAKMGFVLPLMVLVRGRQGWEWKLCSRLRTPQEPQECCVLGRPLKLPSDGTSGTPSLC